MRLENDAFCATVIVPSQLVFDTNERMRRALSLIALSVIGLAWASACTSESEPAPGAVGGNGDAGTYSTTLPTAPPTSDAPPGKDETTPPVEVDGGDAGWTVTPKPTPPFNPYPSATNKIKDLTGPGTSSKNFGVGGTDLGIPVRQPNGKIAYIFGDTWQNDGLGGPGWRSPVLLRSEPGNLSAGITFNGAAGGSYAKQILSYEHDTSQWSTWLPSDVITIENRMYLHFIVNKGLGNVQWTQIAYSDDNGENWTVSNAKFDANQDDFSRQVWTWERGDDGYVYVMSTRFITRNRPIVMYRVPDTKLLDPTAYQPWGYKNGSWAWGNPATPVLDGEWGEICLRRVENKWVLSGFNQGEYNITVKVFDGPTSNLLTANTYTPIQGTNWGSETSTSVAQLYGGYIHPDSTLHDLHLIVSQWNTNSGWPYRAMQFITGVE